MCVDSRIFFISLRLLIFYFCLLFSTVRLIKIFKFNYQIFSLKITFIIFILLFLNLIIENSRTPFDLSEGESELVSAYLLYNMMIIKHLLIII